MTPGEDDPIHRLAEVPADDAAILRQIYGNQLDRVFSEDEELDNEEPQDAPCCTGEENA